MTLFDFADRVAVAVRRGRTVLEGVPYAPCPPRSMPIGAVVGVGANQSAAGPKHTGSLGQEAVHPSEMGERLHDHHHVEGVVGIRQRG